MCLMCARAHRDGWVGNRIAAAAHRIHTQPCPGMLVASTPTLRASLPFPPQASHSGVLPYAYPTCLLPPHAYYPHMLTTPHAYLHMLTSLFLLPYASAAGLRWRRSIRCRGDGRRDERRPGLRRDVQDRKQPGSSRGQGRVGLATHARYTRPVHVPCLGELSSGRAGGSGRRRAPPRKKMLYESSGVGRGQAQSGHGREK